MTAPESDPAVTYSGLLSGPVSADVHDLSAAGRDCVLVRLAGGPIVFTLEGSLADLEPVFLKILGQLATLRRRHAGSMDDPEAPWAPTRPEDLVGADAGTLAEVGRRLLNQSWPPTVQDRVRRTASGSPAAVAILAELEAET